MAELEVQLCLVCWTFFTGRCLVLTSDSSSSYPTYAGLNISWTSSNPRPSGISITGTSIPENSVVGAVVGNLTMADLYGDTVSSWSITGGNFALSGKFRWGWTEVGPSTRRFVLDAPYRVPPQVCHGVDVLVCAPAVWSYQCTSQQHDSKACRVLGTCQSPRAQGPGDRGGANAPIHSNSTMLSGHGNAHE